jgi:predicted RNase H-like HicB family nuclease
MSRVKLTYWQTGWEWVGFLNDYPDEITDADSLEELIERLKEYYYILTSELNDEKRHTIEIDVWN